MGRARPRGAREAGRAGPAGRVERAGSTTSTGRAGTTAWRSSRSRRSSTWGSRTARTTPRTAASCASRRGCARTWRTARAASSSATGDDGESVTLAEYWTLGARATARWMVLSIEQRAEGDHHLDAQIVASPWSDDAAAARRVGHRARRGRRPPRRLHDGGPGRASTSTGDGARRTRSTCRWPTAASRPTCWRRPRGARSRRGRRRWTATTPRSRRSRRPRRSRELLYGGDATRKTRLVVRGPRVQADQDRGGAGRAGAGDDDGRGWSWAAAATSRTATRPPSSSGSKDRATTFTERWTLALDGPADAPGEL